jgi:WXG100 family type VII secretion target
MTSYAATPHTELYAYVWSGSPDVLRTLAAQLAAHHTAVDAATTQLENQLGSVHHSWQGAAADGFGTRFAKAVDGMRRHASEADQTGNAVSLAAEALAAAQQDMPQPPDVVEQTVAGIDQNPLTAIAAQVFTLGVANSVSDSAAQDIQTRHAKASQVMTSLATAYAHAQAQLPSNQDSATAAHRASRPATAGAGPTGVENAAGLGATFTAGPGDLGAAAAGADTEEGLEAMTAASRALRGRGGAEERGKRSAAVKEDKGSWTHESHAGALPPVGLIE